MISADKFRVPRKHTKTVEKQRSLKPSSRKPVGIVVRRGALRRFDGITRKTAELPVVVSWDRRQGDRRASSQPVEDTDQRQTDRRQKPPFTWEVADFVVLDRAPHQSASTRRMARETKRQTSKKKAPESLVAVSSTLPFAWPSARVSPVGDDRLRRLPRRGVE